MKFNDMPIEYHGDAWSITDLEAFGEKMNILEGYIQNAKESGKTELRELADVIEFLFTERGWNNYQKREKP